MDFVELAHRYGKVGGFAHLATLIKQLRSTRPNALLLDGGDTWQGSATALWTQAQDMLEATRLLGVDAMTGHWEFTLGEARLRELLDQSKGWGMEFLAQNVTSPDFGDPIYQPSMLRTINGVSVAVVGQAYPHVELAHPAQVRPPYRFGLEEAALQREVEKVRQAGAQVVVLLSHNGLETDYKLASRLRGVDVILGGHTHDALLQPLVVQNPAGQTLVTNAGSHGKFLAVLDLKVTAGRMSGYQYHLLPVFSQALPADQTMERLIETQRKPWLDKLTEPLATTEELLYRRGNFNGTFDQVILNALCQELDAPIAFSPGFRWGGSLLPHSVITFEDVMNQTAITYSQAQVRQLTGAQIKDYLEDVADNLFNPNPYLQQGGDMVRTSGLTYQCRVREVAGQRIQNLRHQGQPLEANRRYPVAGWAPMEATAGEPVWELVRRNLKAQGTIHNLTLEQPHLG
jgi:sulfur-oxidizing protein SoxB